MEKEYDLIAFLDHMEEQQANKATIEFRFNNYLDSRARTRGIPIKGTFELTPLCNLDCKMCYVHLTGEQLCASGRKMLTGEQWKRIMQQAIDQGLLFALLTGGEAMLHPDFEELYLFLQERGVNVSVNTNGLLLTEERIAFFQQHKPRGLRVTLYGADNETYERVTGKRAFDQVMEAIKRGRDAGIPMVISITPSRYLRLDGAEKLVCLMKEMEIPFAINSSLSAPRAETGRDREEHDMTEEEYFELRKYVARLNGKEIQPLCDDDLPDAGGGEQKETRGFRCAAGRSSFSIVWDGSIQPCLTFTDIQIPLTDTPFSEAWRKINIAVREYPTPSECIGCRYERLCPVCVVQHEAGAPKGHANPAICRNMRRMVREGIVSLD